MARARPPRLDERPHERAALAEPAGYVMAAVFAVSALLARVALSALLGDNVPFLLSFLAITASAVLFGFGPALLATLLSAIGVNILLTPPYWAPSWPLDPSDAIAFALFLFVGSIISWLGGNRRAALRRAELAGEALRDREARLRALTDNLSGVMTYQIEEGPDGRPRFAYVSGTVERLTGVPREDVYADPGNLYRLIDPEHLPRVLEAERAAARDHVPFEVEVPMHLPDGRRRWMRLASTPRRLSDGRRVWDGVQFDLTDQHEAREALRRHGETLERRVAERTEQLARSNRELEQFAVIASHDLKSPLRTISSYLQLIARKYGDRLDEAGLKYLDLTVTAAGRMNDLIDDVLRLSRLGQERRARDVDTARVLREVLDGLDAQVRESGARVHVGDLPPVRADETQLRQVFQNLVGNALKFQPVGGTPEVRVLAAREGALVRLTVRDNGVGIAPEHHDRVFEMFRRVHGREHEAGNGVGLALVKKIVEEHGGRVWVESGAGAGAAFHFTLPAAVGAAEAPPH